MSSSMGITRSREKVEEMITNQDKTREIAVAIFRDDLKSLKKIVEENGKGYTASNRILKAVEYNSVKCLEYLLNEYERVSKTQEQEITMGRRNLALNWPLCERPEECSLHVVASRVCGLEMVKYFEKSTNFMNHYVDKPDSNGSTPLLVAVKRNNAQVAKFFIKHGAKSDERNNDGESPIRCAAMNGLTDVVKEMLMQYSPANKANLLKDQNLYEDGHTVFYSAAQSRNMDILCLLVNESDETDQDGSFLLLKMEMEHPEQNESGNFVCNISASGYCDLLKYLFKKYEDLPKRQDEDGATPLIRAVEADDRVIIEWLLTETEAGLESMEICDKKGRNVFHFAYKNPDLLKILLEHQITIFEDRKVINMRDNEDNTPLKLAADGGFIESFKMLLGYIENEKENELFLDPFVGYTSLETLQIIFDAWKLDDREDRNAADDFIHGTNNFQPPLLGAAAKGDITIMEFLLKNGADGKQQGFDDNTALHYAAACNNLEALEFLVTQYPDMIDSKNDCGQTPIGCAAEMGHVEITKYLLAKKARLTGGNPGENILDCAFGNFEKEHVDEVIMEIIKFCDEKENQITLQQVMENSHFGADCLMGKLVADIPHVAMEVLESCIERKTDLHSRRSGVLRYRKEDVYHFFPIKSQANGDLEAIKSMIKNRRDECLSHPVTRKFLHEKISSLKTVLWLNFNLFLYTVFLLSLTVYTGIQSTDSYSLTSSVPVALSNILLILSVFNIKKEIFQLTFHWKAYICDWDNCIEWIMYISTIIYIVTPEGYQKSSKQICAGAIAVFLSWINFIWFLKRFSHFGIYVIMLKKVLVSVVKVLPMVLLFMIAFVMGFLMLMRGDPGFKSAHNSFLTTFVMMTGEIDFRDNFLGRDDDPVDPLRRLFLLIFILLVSVVLMNLLVGLAVDDISGIMKRSEKEKRLYKASIVVELEKMFHKFPLLSPPTVDDPLDTGKQKERESNMPRLLQLWKRLYKFKEDTGDDYVGEDDGRLKRIEDKLEKLSEMNDSSKQSVQDVVNEMQEKMNKIQTMLENARLSNPAGLYRREAIRDRSLCRE